MRVVLLAPSRSSHTHKWATYYLEKGVDVSVVTFKDHYSEENAKMVPTFVLKKLFPGKFSYIPAVLELRKILNRLKPDILHAHFASSYGFVGALAKFHPYYVSVWGTDIYQFPNRSKLNQKIIEYTLASADVVCSTSHTMAEETKKYTNKKIEVTPFGVDISLFYPKQSRNSCNEFTIGIAKGLEDKYGFRDLFKAFALVRESLSNIKLVIIGDGTMREEYKEICRSLHITDVTHFVGRIPNMKVPEYIREMDLVVMPSYEDSFGVTAVEAMACGVPVVVSDVEGLTEVVVNHQTGIVVPKGNQDMLAKAIRDLLMNESLRVQMGQKGIQHVKTHYDWKENGNKMLELYHHSLDGKKEAK